MPPPPSSLTARHPTTPSPSALRRPGSAHCDHRRPSPGPPPCDRTASPRRPGGGHAPGDAPGGRWRGDEFEGSRGPRTRKAPGAGDDAFRGGTGAVAVGERGDRVHREASAEHRRRVHPTGAGHRTADRRGEVLRHFTMSPDGFVAGPDRAVDWTTGFSSRPGLVGEYAGGGARRTALMTRIRADHPGWCRHRKDRVVRPYPQRRKTLWKLCTRRDRAAVGPVSGWGGGGPCRPSSRSRRGRWPRCRRRGCRAVR